MTGDLEKGDISRRRWEISPQVGKKSIELETVVILISTYYRLARVKTLTVPTIHLNMAKILLPPTSNLSRIMHSYAFTPSSIDNNVSTPAPA